MPIELHVKLHSKVFFFSQKYTQELSPVFTFLLLSQVNIIRWFVVMHFGFPEIFSASEKKTDSLMENVPSLQTHNGLGPEQMS